MKKHPASGFTLIELLVVIAIIGLLSAIVLASLSLARQRGSDASVKQQINQMHAAANLLYSNTGSYDTLCESNTEGGKLFRAAVNQTSKTDNYNLCLSSGPNWYKSVGGAVIPGITPKQVTKDAWAAVVQLKTGSTQQWYCVDSTGASKTQSSRVLDTGIPVTIQC